MFQIDDWHLYYVIIWTFTFGVCAYMYFQWKEWCSQSPPSGSSADFAAESSFHAGYLVPHWLHPSCQGPELSGGHTLGGSNTDGHGSLHLECLLAGCCHQAPLPALLQTQHGVQGSCRTFLPQLSESSMEPLSQHCSWAIVSPFCQYAVTIPSKSHLRLKIKQHRLNFFIPLPKAICTVPGFDMQHCALQTHVTPADSERGNVFCHTLHCSCSDAPGEASALQQSLSPGFFILLQLFKLGFGPGLLAVVVSASFQMSSAMGPLDECLVPMPRQHSGASADGAFAGIDMCPWLRQS